MKMTDEQRTIINAKKEVFKGFNIPWDNNIEDKFLIECAKRPSADKELILDILTHDILVAKIEHKPVSYYLNLLHKEVIIDICGKVGFEALRKNKYIEACGYFYGRKLYAI